MTPDARYQRQIRWIRAMFDLLAIIGTITAVLLVDPFPVAAVLVGCMVFGCLRIAYECAIEIEGWRH